MYPFILFFLLSFFTITSNTEAAVNLHLSNSAISPSADNVIRIDGVTADVDGKPVSGEYWIEFKWDPVKLIFAPVEVGEEPAGETWSWTINTTSYDSFTYTLTSDSRARVFHVTYSQKTGDPFVCSNESFTQGNNSFDVSTFAGLNTALITYSADFSGCGHIIGQTVSGTISSIPSWFEFSKSFVVSYGGVPVVCEPDGTVHN